MVQQPHWEYADTIVQFALQLMHENGQDLVGPGSSSPCHLVVRHRPPTLL
jgi:hypothetical protein